jgi:hypothetical protein
MRKHLALVAAIASLIVGIGVAFATLTPQGVRTSPAKEIGPAAAYTPSGTRLLAWSQDSAAHPEFNAYLKRGSLKPVRINKRGLGFGGGFAGGIDPPLVIYQKIENNESNLRLFNYRTGARTPPPQGVNTADWEWSPDISGDWITFGRNDDESNDQSVLLQSRSHPVQLVLESVALDNEYLSTGQVNGNFVVWTSCGLECDVRKYEIPSDHIPTQGEIVPQTLAKAATATHQNAAAVTSTGTVYLVRRGDNCGEETRIVRFGPSDPAEGTVIASIGDGKDVNGNGGYVRERPGGAVEYFFDRIDCISGTSDIYKVTDPAPTP